MRPKGSDSPFPWTVPREGRITDHHIPSDLENPARPRAQPPVEARAGGYGTVKTCNRHSPTLAHAPTPGRDCAHMSRPTGGRRARSAR